MGDFSPLTESGPVRSLRSLPFPPLCSPNQEQLCSSTVVSHSLSGNLKAIKRAPRCYPTPFCICACVCVCVCLSRLSACAHRDILVRPLVCTRRKVQTPSWSLSRRPLFRRPVSSSRRVSRRRVLWEEKRRFVRVQASEHAEHFAALQP